MTNIIGRIKQNKIVGELKENKIVGKIVLNGASAYEIWVAEGNEGTEQDFLDSLKGSKGDSGVGVPTGGTVGQILTKKSETDYDTEWKDNDADLTDYFNKTTDDMDDISNGATYVKTTNDYTTSEKNKLSGIEAGAEVNNISDENVTDLTDGEATTLHKHSYNNLDDKPTIPQAGTDYLTPSAIAEAYEPLLPTTPENPDIKFLNGNRQWSQISVGSGGYSAPLYYTTIDSDISGYKKIMYMPQATEIEIPATINSGMGEVLLRTYLYDAPIDTTLIDAGRWVFTYTPKVNITSGVTRFKGEIFLRHSDNTETTLFSAYSTELNNTDYLTLTNETTQPAFYPATTDRLGIRFYAVTTSAANVTLTVIIGDGRGGYFTTPLAIRHTQLRDLNGDENHQHIDANDRTNLDNLSGTNTGDQDLSGYATETYVDNKQPFILPYDVTFITTGSSSSSIASDLGGKQNFLDCMTAVDNGREIVLKDYDDVEDIYQVKVMFANKYVSGSEISFWLTFLDQSRYLYSKIIDYNISTEVFSCSYNMSYEIENEDNKLKVVSGGVINASSTDTQYASAKLIYNTVNLKADKTNVLELNNTTAFTPDADYEPATKKYVDDIVGDIESLLGGI